MTTNTTKQAKKNIGSAVGTTILATALLSASSIASASEKCGDVTKGGKNACAVKALGISCQGNVKEDNVPGSWIKVPDGTCANIVAICTGAAEAPAGTSEKKLAKACSKVAEQTDPSVLGGRIVNRYGQYLDADGNIIEG